MWQEKNNFLVKDFTFSDFKTALEFVNKIGQLAEQANHHPDIELSWGRVRVKLSSHDLGRVSKKDHSLARSIDELC